MSLAANQIRLVLRGSVPSKKNALRRRSSSSKGVGYHYDETVKAQMDALVTQARIQWGARRETANPRILITFFVANRRQDRDGMFTTILDALVKARVLHDDNQQWCNGPVTIYPSVVVDPREVRTEILVEAQ